MAWNTLQKQQTTSQSNVVNSSYFVKNDKIADTEFADTTGEQIRTKLSDVNSKKIELIVEVEELLEEENSSNVQDRVIPKQRIEDVLIIAKRWPNSVIVPYLDIDEYGKLYMYVFNDSGRVQVSLLFNGDKNMFAYWIDKGQGSSIVGECNARNHSDVSKFINKLTKNVGKNI